MEPLKKSDRFPATEGPLVEVIMDGIGVAPIGSGNAVGEAHTPTLDWLVANCPNTTIKAHGTAVGLPSDGDMGNSEVGHNALAAGRVFDQGATLVNTDLTGANLTGCRIYGVSAWDVKLDEVTLIITPQNEPEVAVDSIEVAQFVYLLLHNQKIRDVIDTIGKKGVLLLGRFNV